MDSDRDFGHIEKRVREVENIYSLDHYHDKMAKSQVKSKPQTTKMQGCLYDMKSLSTSLGLIHRKKQQMAEPLNSETMLSGSELRIMAHVCIENLLMKS